MSFGFYKFSINSNKYNKIDLPITYLSKSIVIADASGRWGYVNENNIFFPVQYERSVDLLVEWDIKVSTIYAYINEDGIVFPLIVCESNEYEIISDPENIVSCKYFFKVKWSSFCRCRKYLECERYCY